MREQMTRMHERSGPIYIRAVAFCALVCCLASLVSGLIPQLEMSLLGGSFIVGNSIVKGSLFIFLLLGCLLNPSIRSERYLTITWLAFVLFLICEIGYLSLAYGVPLTSILGSYNAMYLVSLVGIPFLVFKIDVSEKVIVRAVVLTLLVCAVIGLAQYISNQPLLHTESADGAFVVASWNFFGRVRAFSLFDSALEYGIFCALCGALGVALLKRHRMAGVLLLAVSAFACYTTLTRLCYLVFGCACIYAFILTFGKRLTRGLWQPLLFLLFGIGAMVAGLSTNALGSPNGLQDASSLFERIEEWTYGYGLISNASLSHKLMGMGITQNANFSKLPVIIDSSPLALVLHIGFAGLFLFTLYSIFGWLYLRREAITNKQPFVIAAASLWSTLLCAGLFSIIFSSFGAVFTMAILCKTEKRNETEI